MSNHQEQINEIRQTFSPKIRFEDCYQSGQKFPHVYGPLPVEAVIQVLDFEPGPDGCFALPATLVAAIDPDWRITSELRR